jgi:hypothetical protein
MTNNVGLTEIIIILLIIALLALPILAVILVGVALVNRSKGASRTDQWPQQHVPPPAAPATLADRLTQLEQARAAGLLTDDEYAARREKMLGDA